jgi:hypothetical protein
VTAEEKPLRYCDKCKQPIGYSSQLMEASPYVVFLVSFWAVAVSLPYIFNVDLAFLAVVLPPNWYFYIAAMSLGFNGLIAVCFGLLARAIRNLYRQGRIGINPTTHLFYYQKRPR